MLFEKKRKTKLLRTKGKCTYKSDLRLLCKGILFLTSSKYSKSISAILKHGLSFSQLAKILPQGSTTIA